MLQSSVPLGRGYLIPGDTKVGLPGTELEAGQGRVLGRLSVHKFPFGGVNPSSPDKEGSIQRETGLGLAICKGIVEHYQGEHYAFLTIRLGKDLKLRRVSILGLNCYILDPVRHAEQH